MLNQEPFHKDISGSGDKWQLLEFLNLAPDRGELLASCSGFFMCRERTLSIGVTVHFGPCEEDGSSVCVSESFTAAGTPCPRELGTSGLWKSYKGEKPGHCASLGKERQKIQQWQIHLRSCTPTAGNSVQTGWCIGTVHKIYLVLNYLIIEVT